MNLNLICSSQSTFKGRQSYRMDLRDIMRAVYDQKDREMSCPVSNLRTIREFEKNQEVSFSEDDEWMKDHIAFLDSIEGYFSTEGNVSRALMEKSLKLSKAAQSWVGSEENDKWAKLVPIVQNELPQSAFTVTQLARKLDLSRHLALRRPFSSFFKPDFAAGLLAIAGRASRLFLENFCESMSRSWNLRLRPSQTSYKISVSHFLAGNANLIWMAVCSKRRINWHCR